MKSFSELQAQLDQIIEWFESDQVDIDEAVDKFKQGQKLIAELNERIAKAELQIKKIKKA
ncbi:exodeoxyribonuclease VII small subunit [Candidatus Saccharibacteria bacterium]|jgi:exodeoxyribonuclease VII small subunit|nr:MAG: exodeoxyribonuclease VII small subunit [Candidatus Saccharibacteria bacterium]